MRKKEFVTVKKEIYGTSYFPIEYQSIIDEIALRNIKEMEESEILKKNLASVLKTIQNTDLKKAIEIEKNKSADLQKKSLSFDNIIVKHLSKEYYGYLRKAAVLNLMGYDDEQTNESALKKLYLEAQKDLQISMKKIILQVRKERLISNQKSYYHKK